MRPTSRSTLGVRNLGNGPFNLALSVSPAPDGKGVRGSVVGKIGEFDISGDGELSEPTEMGNLTLRTEISGPDVSLLAGIVGFDRLPPEQFHFVATVRRTGSLLRDRSGELELPDSALSVRGSVARIDKFSGNDLTIRISRRLAREVPQAAARSRHGDRTVRHHRHDASRADTAKTCSTSTSTTTLARRDGQRTVGRISGVLRHAPAIFRQRRRTSGRSRSRRRLTNAPRAPFSAQGQFEWSPSGVVLARRQARRRRRHAERRRRHRQSTRLRQRPFASACRAKPVRSVAAYRRLDGIAGAAVQSSGHIPRQNGRTRLEGVDVTCGRRAAAGRRATFATIRRRIPSLNFTSDGNDLSPFKALRRT